MWITVNNTLVQDAKLKKVRSIALHTFKCPQLTSLSAYAQLLDALKSNKTVTSLDLSQNQLTDEGASVSAMPAISPCFSPTPSVA
jgi:hypothetical protein